LRTDPDDAERLTCIYVSGGWGFEPVRVPKAVLSAYVVFQPWTSSSGALTLGRAVRRLLYGGMTT